MTTRTSFAVLTTAFMMAAGLAWAAVPQSLYYKGYLTDRIGSAEPIFTSVSVGAADPILAPFIMTFDDCSETSSVTTFTLRYPQTCWLAIAHFRLSRTINSIEMASLRIQELDVQVQNDFLDQACLLNNDATVSYLHLAHSRLLGDPLSA